MIIIYHFSGVETSIQEAWFGFGIAFTSETPAAALGVYGRQKSREILTASK